MMAEPHFVIQGVAYPVPAWETFTMDESQILYEHAGLTLDAADEDTKFTPGLVRSLMVVALMRGNPTMSRKQAEKIVGAVPLLDALANLAEDEEDEDADEGDAGPPVPTVAAGGPKSSPGSSDAPPNDSGSGSVTGSDVLPASPPPTPIGTLPSATPPAPSDPETLAS
jgi:hypothetical protein